MVAYPTPVTLAYLLSLAVVHSSLRQKRYRATTSDGEGDIEDTGASDSGGLQTKDASDTAGPTMLPPHDPRDREKVKLPRNWLEKRGYGIWGLICTLNPKPSPPLPEPNQLEVDHISALLALAVDGHVHKAAIKLIAPAYS